MSHITDEQLIKNVADRISEIAALRGTQVAAQFFAIRGSDNGKATVTESDLAGLLALVYFQGMEEGIAARHRVEKV